MDRNVWRSSDHASRLAFLPAGPAQDAVDPPPQVTENFGNDVQKTRWSQPASNATRVPAAPGNDGESAAAVSENDQGSITPFAEPVCGQIAPLILP